MAKSGNHKCNVHPDLVNRVYVVSCNSCSFRQIVHVRKDARAVIDNHRLVAFFNPPKPKDPRNGRR